jgi:hypothetical protein
MEVGRLLNRRAARQKYGDEVWDADLYAEERPGTGTIMDFNRRVPDSVVRSLTFLAKSGRTAGGEPTHRETHIGVDPSGELTNQTLRAVRRLTPGSAHALDQLL